MKLRIILGLVTILSIAQIAVGLLRPLPPLVFSLNIGKTFSGQDLSLSWPTSGQSAISNASAGLLSSSTNQIATPTASTIKILTALMVLNKYPITDGGEGSTITLTKADVDRYNYYYSKNGSVVAVEVGEKITQLQALQAMLIPSGNNMADSLAVWAYDSISNYLTQANKYVKSIGMNDTTIDDASGLSSSTKSTAVDMALLAEVAMANPVISKIVAMPSATVPVAGVIKNTNWLLEEQGVIGIKTGMTTEAGGCFLLATNGQVDGKSVTQYVAVLGQSTRNQAIINAKNIADESLGNMEWVEVVTKGQVAGYAKAKWQAKTVNLSAGESVNVLRWKNSEIKTSSSLESGKVNTLNASQKVGSIGAADDRVDIVSGESIKPPSIWWRITNNGIVRR